MVDRVMALPEGTRAATCSPPSSAAARASIARNWLEWQKAGFTRVRIDGEIHEIDEAPALDKKYKHDIEVVVDRLVVARGHRAPASPRASRPR